MFRDSNSVVAANAAMSGLAGKSLAFGAYSLALYGRRVRAPAVAEACPCPLRYPA